MRIAENCYPVGFQMTCARDLDIAHAMGAHTWQEMLFTQPLRVGMLPARLSSDYDQIAFQIEVARLRPFQPAQQKGCYVELKVKEGWQ
jgi:hypothetical protein